ncbi:4-amino-4-deoxy-L-arabinose transferase-like glycosyltransferase [Pedobacter cryoconitis]|uniref:4-amino-4-deoxy-L-arabinose transferase-like glycosyltransferase n=1 Tax=Pedobacter cryoconitis TaxID=188932 RepID=A0A7W8ZM88_9SPHI|nr:glycosyltransferase family 39 protein [Pedobacter cryoconitis]MBB5636435.1 4-amino-4-deoxy-L-arabinose transferase-like glycosyltransferase [Pedobacter cryoconitis]MBB6274509.1 4-amino-4-deoxy-L-arabinose transferase-like glycosyltransferase [Pedobacter cryoconitis]
MQKVLADQTTKWLYLFIGFAVLLNFTGLFVTVIGPDGALYATIAKGMAQHNNFSDLLVEGKDWLDKPHFPFWITAVFFKIFGINTWAYKLPGILFVLLAAFYTYKFAKELYTKQIALWAALFLLTAQHILICTMDVRAEPFLTGLIIASVYHFYKCLGKQWFLHLLIASVFAACAVMTKGVFALIPIGGAIGGHLLIRKDWIMVFNFRWLLALVLILIFMLPELYTLYNQFDIHPEKIIFGRQGVSGIRFFFWDSQFGRFFNNGPIKKSSGDPTFFLHTILWAFLPWSLLFYTAVFQFFRQNFKKPVQAEWYCISGSLLTLLIFSLSKFQLPFYITIVFPFFSILCAQYLCNLKLESSVKAIRLMQLIVGGIMMFLIIVLHYFFRPDNLTVFSSVLLLGAVVLFVMVSFTPVNGRYKVFFQVCAVAFFVNLYFNLAYYPRLVKYQADSEAAFWINAHNEKDLPVVRSRIGYAFGMDFYLNAPLYFLTDGDKSLLPAKPYLLYADTELIDQYIKQGVKVQRLKTFEGYRITKVNGKFLNHATRKGVLSTTEVVLIN